MTTDIVEKFGNAWKPLDQSRKLTNTKTNTATQKQQTQQQLINSHFAKFQQPLGQS